MKKILFAILCVLLFCQTVYAGEWVTDENGTKYLNDDGTHKTGWHQDVDAKWYYLDDNTGYILKSTITPDGYSVSKTGEWMMETEMTNELKKYDNFTEISVRTMSKQFEHSIPMAVHYNNTYNNPFGGVINVLGIELSKEGAPYISLSSSDVAGYGGITQKYKIILADGNVVDGERHILDQGDDLNSKFSMLRGPDINDIFEQKTVISVEVWINEYVPEN